VPFCGKSEDLGKKTEGIGKGPVPVAVIKEDKLKIYPKKSKRPLRAIRYFCFGWDRRERDAGRPIDDVRNCTDPACPLFDFRFGKNPFLKGTPGGNPEALKQWQASLKSGSESTGTERSIVGGAV
jgi:hypothetical protein